MDAVITVVILAAAAVIILVRDERKYLSRILADHEADEQFRRDHAAGVAGGGRDKLDALVEATRERWGPEANLSVPYLPVEVTDFDLWEDEL